MHHIIATQTPSPEWDSITLALQLKNNWHQISVKTISMRSFEKLWLTSSSAPLSPPPLPAPHHKALEGVMSFRPSHLILEFNTLITQLSHSPEAVKEYINT